MIGELRGELTQINEAIAVLEQLVGHRRGRPPAWLALTPPKKRGRPPGSKNRPKAHARKGDS